MAFLCVSLIVQSKPQGLLQHLAGGEALPVILRLLVSLRQRVPTLGEGGQPGSTGGQGGDALLQLRLLGVGFALRCAGCGGAVGGVEIQEMCIAKTFIRGYNDFGKVFSRDAF